MTDEVRDAYDAMAAEYTAFALEEFDRVRSDRDSLAAFAGQAAAHEGAVADLGCGPGHVANHLAELGLDIIGYDLSPALIAEARRVYPHVRFHVGDLAALESGDASLGGILSRYSLIHVLPSRHDSIFGEWRRALAPGAPLLLSFFASSSTERHGTAFDHAVVTAYELFPATIAHQLEDAGFTSVDVAVRGPLEGARRLDHATVRARTPAFSP